MTTQAAGTGPRVLRVGAARPCLGRPGTDNSGNGQKTLLFGREYCCDRPSL